MGGEEINAAFSGKLAGLNATSQSIETLSHWCVFHRKRAKTLVPTWQQELRAAPPKRKLTFLYLANDVLQNSRKKGNEWIEACWPIMGWAVKHTLRNTGDEKTAKSCEKLVNVWQDRRIFGSRSLRDWLDVGDGRDRTGGDDAAAPEGQPAAPAAAPAAPAGPAVARRREERLAEVPAALTGTNASLARALEAAEKAAAALAAADALCETDLKPEAYADDALETSDDPVKALRALQAAENAITATRVALEEAAGCHEEAARYAKDVLERCEAAAEAQAAALDDSAGVMVKVATLRMKATKRAAAELARQAAAEGAGSKNPKASAPSTKSGGEDPAPAAAAAATEPAGDDEYVPEGGDDEYVPMAMDDPPPEEGGVDVDALMAQAASDPEVMKQLLAALPEDQRAAVEEQLAAAGK